MEEVKNIEKIRQNGREDDKVGERFVCRGAVVMIHDFVGDNSAPVSAFRRTTRQKERKTQEMLIYKRCV